MRLLAKVDVTLGGVVTTGDVGVTATTGSILDGGDQLTDVKASGLRLVAGVGAGASANALEIEVGTLSGRGGAGGILVLEKDAVTVGDVDVQARRVDASGGTGTGSSSDALQSDLRTTDNGSIVLRTTAGSIVLDNGSAPGQPGDDASVSADGTGAVLIQAGVDALDISSDITAHADVRSGSGNISVIAGRHVSFTGTADIRSGGAGTIDVQATSGSIGMADGSLFDAGAGDVRLLAKVDVTLGGVVTTGDVGVTATTGSILDGGDQHADVKASGLRLVAGVGAGASSNALETEVGTLSALAGAGGLFVLESDAVTVGDVGVQALRVTVDGSSSSTPDSGDATQSKLRTTDNGSIELRTTAGDIVLDASVSADGSGSVLIQAGVSPLDATSAVKAYADVTSGSGDVSVKASKDVSFAGDAAILSGTFVADVPQNFDAPVKVQTSSVEVTATLSGTTLHVTPPNALMLPMVIGTPVKVIDQPPATGIFVDGDEVARLQFEDIVFGGQDMGQQVWLQTDPGQPQDKLLFTGRLTVETPLGETRLAGRIEGVGMEIKGRGQTTYLDGADVLHSSNVTIDDALIVRKDSIIEVADPKATAPLVLTIQGDITVEEGVTLQLLADEIYFAPYSNPQNDPLLSSAVLHLKKGATLVLGATKITVDQDVTFDSDGGHVQLRGAPSATKAQSVGAAGTDWAPVADFEASGFAPDAQTLGALDDLVAWLAADTDTDDDGRLASLTLGSDEAATSIATPTPWTVLQAGGSMVQLRGTTVDLGTASGAAVWTFPTETTLRAASGDLHLHVDLAVSDGVSLTAQQGALFMDAAASIVANGPVALTAPDGVTISQIESDTRIDVHSAAGIVQSTGAVTGGVHLTARSVSIHGVGLRIPVADATDVPVARAATVQVSGVRGMTFEGRGADGSIVYRTMSRGVAYEQLRMADDGAARVLVARSELQGSATRIGQGEPVSMVYASPLGASTTSFAPLAAAGAGTGTGTAVSSYLDTAGRAGALSWGGFPSLASERGGLDLNDLSYGIEDGSQGRSVLSDDPGAPLLLSSGQVATEPIWTMETNLFS